MAASKKLPLFLAIAAKLFQLVAGKRHYRCKAIQQKKYRRPRHSRHRTIPQTSCHQFYPMLVRQKHIPQKNNSGVGHQGIIVVALHLLCQRQVLFGHFEKHLYVPTSAVNSNDVFI